MSQWVKREYAARRVNVVMLDWLKSYHDVQVRTRTHVCMYVYMYVGMQVSMYMYMYVCMYICHERMGNLTGVLRRDAAI